MIICRIEGAKVEATMMGSVEELVLEAGIAASRICRAIHDSGAREENVLLVAADIVVAMAVGNMDIDNLIEKIREEYRSYEEFRKNADVGRGEA